MNKDLNFNLNAESIKKFGIKIYQDFKRYAVEIFAVFVLVVYGFLVWQVNSMSNIAPSEEKIAEEQQIIKKPQIDEQTIQKIEQLEDQNIAVQALFKSARENPFGE
jgi:predicted negative regulator of RcsB-dependent stress response